VYPELVRERERREHRLGKWLALGASMGSVLARFRPLEGTITADGDRRALEASIVLVGNNRFSTAPGSIGRRPRLDEGVLEVRVVPARTGMRSRSRLALSLARARPFPRRTINRTARRVEIALAGGPRRVAYDGEQDDEAELVVATVEPRALRVLAPPRFDEPPD
jgi:diacylglycerol kinase family enzyme